MHHDVQELVVESVDDVDHIALDAGQLGQPAAQAEHGVALGQRVRADEQIGFLRSQRVNSLAALRWQHRIGHASAPRWLATESAVSGGARRGGCPEILGSSGDRLCDGPDRRCSSRLRQIRGRTMRAAGSTTGLFWSSAAHAAPSKIRSRFQSSNNRAEQLVEAGRRDIIGGVAQSHTDVFELALDGERRGQVSFAAKLTAARQHELGVVVRVPVSVRAVGSLRR